MEILDGNAIVYCKGAFNTPNGKTAHGLVRRTIRYNVLGVIDSNYAGQDAGNVLDGKIKNIPVFASLEEALGHFEKRKIDVSYFVIGIAPDGGRLSENARTDVKKALKPGIECGQRTA